MNTKGHSKGAYKLKNPAKYMALTPPIFRSSYELRAFRFFDMANAVTRWGVENIHIPYFDPIRNKQRRYIMDVYVEYTNKAGVPKIELVEIKPSEQLRKPKKTKRMSRTTYETKYRTYCTNCAKWEAANAYAKSKGWQFRILTEKTIF